MKFSVRNILNIYKSIKKLRRQHKMAFLLLVYEKMRLQRKVNKLTLRQTQLSSRKERIAKNIEKVQKMYSSKITNAEKQAQLWASQAKNSIFNSMGLGMQNQMILLRKDLSNQRNLSIFTCSIPSSKKTSEIT